MISKEFEQAVERGTGMSVAYIRNTPLDELRADQERLLKRTLPIVSKFPWIGRGHVLFGRLISRKKINDSLDDAIRKL